MKELIICTTHDSILPIKGGGALRTLNVACEFKKRGYQVLLIAPAEECGEREVYGVRFIPINICGNKQLDIFEAFILNVKLLIIFYKYANMTRIFFSHNTIMAVFIFLFKKLFNFKFILSITELHSAYLFIGKRSLIEKILAPYLLKYEYLIIKSADFILTGSKTLKNLLISKGVKDSKIEVAYEGVDKQQFSIIKEENAQWGIIHLGLIDDTRGVGFIIEAIPLVSKVYPKAKFFFIGGGKGLDKVKALANKLGVEDKCIFTGFLSHKKAIQCLEKACIGIIPRKYHIANRVAPALKLFEYWASGTAVISSPLDSIKEITKDNKDILFFEPNNVNDLATKIIFLLTKDDIRRRLVANGLEKVKKFSWYNTSSKIVDLVVCS